jgi:flagellar motor protein MotB
VKFTLLPWVLWLGTVAVACVPQTAYNELLRQNGVLKQEAERNQSLAQDRSDLSGRNADLALQNHQLEIGNAALLEDGRARNDYYDSVDRDLRREISDGQLRITRYKEMLTLTVADEILFDSGKADLKTEGKAILLHIGRTVVKGDRCVRVVGYTDNEALAEGAPFATNWQLSTARATTVVRFLQDNGGLDPRRLSATGRGEWMPVATNATAEGRQQNRRITITLVDSGLLDGPEGPISKQVNDLEQQEEPLFGLQ